MKPEDQCLFRQLKRFHKRYYETHGHDAASHQLTRGIVQQMFPGYHPPTLRPLPRRGLNCWPRNESRSCANSWDWLSPLSCRRTHHDRRHLSTCHRRNHHNSCQDKRRRGQLNSRHGKKLRPSRTSSPEGWPPRI